MDMPSSTQDWHWAGAHKDKPDANCSECKLETAVAGLRRIIKDIDALVMKYDERYETAKKNKGYDSPEAKATSHLLHDYINNTRLPYDIAWITLRDLGEKP